MSAYVKSMYIKSSARSLVHARCSIDAYSIKMVTVKETESAPEVLILTGEFILELFIEHLTCGASYGRVSFNMDPLSPKARMGERT